MQCCSNYRNLHPAVDNFTVRDGVVKRLIVLRGTVQVPCSTFTYTVPLAVWVMPYHPRGPPLVFVHASGDMELSSKHPHVDSTSGLVYSAYLSQWQATRSTLQGAVGAIIEHFASTAPPLRHSSLDHAERHALIATLSRRAAATLAHRHTAATATAQSLLASRHQLLTSCELSRTVRWTNLSTTLLELRQRADALRAWLHLHPSPEAGATVDERTQPRLVVQQQLISSSAHDNAISDALDQLDEAMSVNQVPHDEYIRSIRRLARDQFFVRALLLKLKSVRDDT